MPKYTVKTGKNGNKMLRQDDGKGIVIMMMNEQGEQEDSNEFVERVAAALEYVEGIGTREVQEMCETRRRYIYCFAFRSVAYDYNRHGIAAFKMSEPSLEEYLKAQMNAFADQRQPLLIQVWTERL